ncbi:hypothetical protein DOT98_15685 [Clavibacter michiganensis subsp. michiganensis]|nr:hypothetical protein [Clavibacter michiganensis subsp. michiganensis]
MVFAALAILSLVTSLVVTSVNYKARSRDMFLNYRKVQRLSVEAEALKAEDPVTHSKALARLSSQYQDLLDESENHTTRDHIRALRDIEAKDSAPKSSTGRRLIGIADNLSAQAFITFLPFLALGIPILVLLPIVQWVISNS